MFLVPVVAACLNVSYLGCGPHDTLTHFEEAWHRASGLIASDGPCHNIPLLERSRRRRWQCRVAHLVLLLRLSNHVCLFGNACDLEGFLGTWKRGLQRSAIRMHLVSDPAPGMPDPDPLSSTVTTPAPLVRILLSDAVWGTSSGAHPRDVVRWRVALILACLVAAHGDVVPWPSTPVDPLIEYVLDQESNGQVDVLDHPMPWFAALWKHALQVSAEHVRQPALLSRLWSHAIDL